MLRVARWYLAAVAVLLLGITVTTIVSHAAQAAQGITLVFSQEEMRGGGGGGIGPAPTEGDATGPSLPPEATTGGMQYVDVPSLGLTLAGGVMAAAAAIALFRRSRWAVPLGLAGAGVAAGVGLIPASIGLWAAEYYGTASGEVAPFLVVSAGLVLLALLCALAIWQGRAALRRA